MHHEQTWLVEATKLKKSGIMSWQFIFPIAKSYKKL